MRSRIVITGLGVISCIGIGKDSFWNALIEGKNGIKEISSFDTTGCKTHFGGEVNDFVAGRFIKENNVLKMGRSSQFAVAATKMALEDAGLDINSLPRDAVGVSIGTTMGESQTLREINQAWIKEGYQNIPKGLIAKYPTNTISNNIAVEFGFGGPVVMISTACAAGNCAIAYGCDVLRSGKTATMVVGGVDSFSPFAFAGFNRLFAIAPKRCQPFDKNRRGMMLSEGAGILILETLDNATERSANIYAEVIGYGLSCDAYHMVNLEPDGKGIVMAYKDLFKHSDLLPDDIDYISAHGTGTIINDKVETNAIKDVFGVRAKNIPISSIKSMIGHAMGAASAIEAVTSSLILQNDLIPPTINYDEPDPECDLDYVPNRFRKQRVNIAISNSFGFGGNNALVAFGKYLNSGFLR